MNANSLPQTLVFKDWLSDATRRLIDVMVPSANLDAEVILAHAIQKDRTYLHAHTEQLISTDQLKTANKMLEQRLNRVPIAYIIGYKEFYGHNFITTPAVLIPRPESETIIDILKEILKPNSNSQIPIANLIDVGTGSGCLGITAKLEFPNLNVTLTDISAEALEVATLNANALQADISTLQSDLLQNYTQKADIIIANLPYVDKVWERSTETNYEPNLALFADNHGISLIEQLIVQAENSLNLGGYLIIEADPVQHKKIINLADKNRLSLVNQQGYIVALKRQ